MKNFLILSLVVFATSSAFAQTATNNCTEYGGKSVPILQSGSRKFKIKVANGVSSKTAREADYVEFRTMEPIYSTGNPPVVLFAKDTPIYGLVTRRKSRHFPLRRGKLELQLERLVNWNGDEIEIAISRHGPLVPIDRPKQRNDACKPGGNNCVAGRGNAEVGILVPAVAAGAGGAVAALADEEETTFIAATAFFSVAKELGNLLNGTDVEIAKDEIFDLTIDAKQQTVCAMPDAKATSSGAPVSPSKLQLSIAGEIDRNRRSVSITTGELKGATFTGIGPAMDALKKLGYRKDAVEQLRTVLERSLEDLAKIEKGEKVSPHENLPGEPSEQPAESTKSLVAIQRKNGNTLQFQVFAGSEAEIGAVYDLTKCEKMNDKCFLCPDYVIRCTILALTKEVV